MLKKSGVTVNADVTLRDSKRALLWPKESTGMYIKKTGKNKELGIFYAPWSYERRGGVEIRDTITGPWKWIFCGLGLQREMGTELIFKEGRVVAEQPHYPYKGNVPMKVKVELGDECAPKMEKGIIECNLKVTDGSDLKFLWAKE